MQGAAIGWTPATRLPGGLIQDHLDGNGRGYQSTCRTELPTLLLCHLGQRVE